MNNQREVVFQKVEGKSTGADDSPNVLHMHQSASMFYLPGSRPEPLLLSLRLTGVEMNDGQR